MTESSEQAAASRWHILMITAAMYGIAFNWGAQYSRVTPILEELGLSAALLGMAWLVGPVSGIVIQPWVGHQSDRTRHRWGRRRIWMLFAMTGLATSNVLMAFPRELASCFFTGDAVDTWAIYFALTAFWFADVFINMAQVPCRVLVVDLLPMHQISRGNAYLGVWEGLGKVSAFAVGSFAVEEFFPSWKRSSGTFFANVQFLFIVGNFVMVASFALTFAAAKEKQLQLEMRAQDTSSERCILAQIWDVLRGLSPLSKYVWVALCCTNFAWFVSWMYIPAYMGIDIMGGDPLAKEGTEAQNLYHQGASLLASRAMLLQSTISLVLSPCFPYVMKRMRSVSLWMFCELVHAVVYCLTPVIKAKELALLDLGLQGIAWAAFLVIPYSIMGKEAKTGTVGGEALFISLMNLALCIPEIVASIVVGPVVLLAGGSNAAPIVLAGIACLLVEGVLVFARRYDSPAGQELQVGGTDGTSLCESVPPQN